MNNNQTTTYPREQIDMWRKAYLGNPVWSIQHQGFCAILGKAKCTGIHVDNGSFRLEQFDGGLDIKAGCTCARSYVFLCNSEISNFLERKYAINENHKTKQLYDIFQVSDKIEIKVIKIREDPWTGEEILEYLGEECECEPLIIDRDRIAAQGHFIVEDNQLIETVIALKDQIDDAESYVPDFDPDEIDESDVESEEEIELECASSCDSGFKIKFVVKNLWLKQFWGLDNEAQLEALLLNGNFDGTEILEAAQKDTDVSGFRFVKYASSKGSIRLIEADVLQVNAAVLVHQVNCKGVMGAGIAKQIKTKYPEVFEKYVALCNKYQDNTSELLGTCQFVDVGDTTICNAFGQDGFGGSERKTNYNALRECFRLIALRYTYIAMPYKIGCGLAGGDWNVVYSMIIEELVEHGCHVTLCKLPS